MFTPSLYQAHAPAPDDLVFVCRDRDVLVNMSRGRPVIPAVSDLQALDVTLDQSHHIGGIDGRTCRAIAHAADTAPDTDTTGPGTVPGVAAGASAGAGADDHVWEFRSLRTLMSDLPESHVRAAGSAAQIIDWDRNNRFCGRCGHQMEQRTGERAKACPTCGLVAYPRISPAVIVAVLNAGSILLASNRRHRKSGMFSIIAGFVEPGENLEQAVCREIKEEVDIAVTDLTYFASQPWPFPDSLMVGFTARYDSGTVRPDGTEIVEADWFSRDALPVIPPVGTISRRIIDAYVEGRL